MPALILWILIVEHFALFTKQSHSGDKSLKDSSFYQELSESLSFKFTNTSLATRNSQLEAFFKIGAFVIPSPPLLLCYCSPTPLRLSLLLPFFQVKTKQKHSISMNPTMLKYRCITTDFVVLQPRSETHDI